MKTFLRTKPIVLALGAALVLTTAIVRADDDAKPKYHRHAAKAAEKTTEDATIAREKTTHVVKGAKTIPTRDDRNSREVNGASVGGANGSEYRVQTGTNIPKHYDRRGYTTNSDQNSFIYDKNDQRLRAHDNVSEGLRDVPGLSINSPISK